MMDAPRAGLEFRYAVSEYDFWLGVPSLCVSLLEDYRGLADSSTDGVRSGGEAGNLTRPCSEHAFYYQFQHQFQPSHDLVVPSTLSCPSVHSHSFGLQRATQGYTPCVPPAIRVSGGGVPRVSGGASNW